jgi:hypothetical protein
VGISKSEANIAWVPVATACRMLRISRQRIYQLLSEGKISGRMCDRVWLINQTSIDSRIALLERESEIGYGTR